MFKSTRCQIVSLPTLCGNAESVPTEIERLYREERAGLVRLVARELHDHHDAEDVVQTAFLDAQRALERGTIPRNPRAWLATIALNAARRLRRRRLNAEPLEEYAVQEALGMSELRAALANLPLEQRAAVLYRDLLGLSYRETATQMGTSVDAVTMLLHRGRKRLRQTIGVAVAGFGLSRWLKRAGLPQLAAAKGTAAVVVAAGLATTGVVAARVVAPMGADAAAAPPAPVAGPSAAAAAAGTSPGALTPRPARRHFRTADRPATSAAGASTQGSGSTATPASAGSSTAAATSTSSPSSLLQSSLPVPAVSVSATVSSTDSATVAVSTPVATVTVATPTVPPVTVTTPIITVTVPIP